MLCADRNQREDNKSLTTGREGKEKVGIEDENGRKEGKENLWSVTGLYACMYVSLYEQRFLFFFKYCFSSF